MPQARKETAPPLDMPRLYFELTTPEEQARHAAKLARLPRTRGLIVEAVQAGEDWLFELVTLDWDEPGLLDKIFEAILRCHHNPDGVSIRRIRSFTGHQRQVVCLLALRDRYDRPLTRGSAAAVLRQLRRVRPEERGVLETIQHLAISSLIPLIGEVPVIDNDASPHYTRIELHMERLSNRFTSVLLHYLARSELWLNIQIADFERGVPSRYIFYVVDKHGAKLTDTAFMRLSLVRTVEAVNAMLTRFNVMNVRRLWHQRIEGNDRTIYHSPPDFGDLLDDLYNIRQLAGLKGFESRLSHLVEGGVLDSRSFYFLKKAETFVTENREANHELVRTGPDAAAVELCREYFEYRRRSIRILIPLFERLARMPTRKPLLDDRAKLAALAGPLPQQHYALDADERLYIDGPIWLGEPVHALDPFLLLARTDAYVREDTMEAIEASLEGWTPSYIQAHRADLGTRFLEIVDESIRQNNTAIVMRNMRSVGLLQRYVPGFDHIQGRIHVNRDHAYTVDEHSVVAIEVLQGLGLMGEVLPRPGRATMRADYERLRDAAALQNYARKYAMELRMLGRATPLRNNPQVRSYFRFMEDVRINSLEYLIEMNMLDFGYETCMTALTEIETLRNQLDALIRLYRSLPFEDRRVLMLCGLLHDLKKPAVDHDRQGADVVQDVTAAMGLALSERELRRLEWLVRNHLRMRPLINQVGAEGEGAIRAFVAEVGDPSLLHLLLLFTYADRVAVSFDRNKNSHDAMVLTEMLRIVNRDLPLADDSGAIAGA